MNFSPYLVNFDEFSYTCSGSLDAGLYYVQFPGSCFSMPVVMSEDWLSVSSFCESIDMPFALFKAGYFDSSMSKYVLLDTPRLIHVSFGKGESSLSADLVSEV